LSEPAGDFVTSHVAQVAQDKGLLDGREVAERGSQVDVWVLEKALATLPRVPPRLVFGHKMGGLLLQSDVKLVHVGSQAAEEECAVGRWPGPVSI
jgi:hypothetical protein